MSCGQHDISRSACILTGEETEVRCPNAERLRIHYEAPDETIRPKRLWNGGTDFGRLKLYRKTDGKKS